MLLAAPDIIALAANSSAARVMYETYREMAEDPGVLSGPWTPDADPRFAFLHRVEELVQTPAGMLGTVFMPGGRMSVVTWAVYRPVSSLPLMMNVSLPKPRPTPAVAYATGPF